MRPRSYDFRIARGATPLLGIILHGRDPRTGEIVRLPRARADIEWVIDWPSKSETLSTRMAGGLNVDRRTGAIYFPVSAEHLDDLKALDRGRSVPTQVRLVTSDGFAIPYLVGTVGLEG